MMKFDVNIKKLNDKAIIPTYGTEYAAGADLYACMDEAVTINPGETHFIKTGIAMEVPVGYAGLIYARSGLACKKGLAPANKVGVVDSDYRGEIMLSLINHGKEDFTVEPNMRLAQLIAFPVLSQEWIETDTLDDTERSTGGFGSSGNN